MHGFCEKRVGVVEEWRREQRTCARTAVPALEGMDKITMSSPVHHVLK